MIGSDYGRVGLGGSNLQGTERVLEEELQAPAALEGQDQSKPGRVEPEGGVNLRR